MTLAEFLKENYKDNNIEKNVLVQKNEEFKEILNKKLCVLYNDYITSRDFKNKVIKRIELKYNNFYVERYKTIAANFLNYFSVLK